MNLAVFLGNLSTDVSVRTLQDGQRVASFFVAVDRPKSEQADFIPVTVWNGTADACQKYLSKGSRVSVEGSIRTRRYEQDGQTKYAWEIRARSVQFLSRRENTPETASTEAPEPQTDDDIPF